MSTACFRDRSAIDIELTGFAMFRAGDVRVRAGGVTHIGPVMRVGANVLVEVEGGSRRNVRGPGVETHFGREDIWRQSRRPGAHSISSRPHLASRRARSQEGRSTSSRSSVPESRRTASISTAPTSPRPATASHASSLASTSSRRCRSSPSEHRSSHGNLQGAVINFITRQGSDRWQYDTSYFAQPGGLTSEPVRLGCGDCGEPDSGYHRSRYRDFTTSLGGPAIRDRLWFFAGYQYLRDNDSQPGTDPDSPRKYEQNKLSAKLTWQLAKGWQLIHSVQAERWVNPEQPTYTKKISSTQEQRASSPAMTLAHLTHSASANTVWDVRVGQLRFSQESSPTSGDRLAANRSDLETQITTGGPQQIGGVDQIRTSAKGTVSHYQTGLLGSDHEWRIGGSLEKGEHRSLTVIPSGERFTYRTGIPAQRFSAAPSNAGGQFITSAAFVSDTFTVQRFVTITAGLRFDHNRAISQDVRELDADGRDTGNDIAGLGTLYTENVLSPRLGFTARLGADGRTLLRGSYGRFSQGVMTGEVSPVHPGQAVVTMTDYNSETGTSSGHLPA